MPNNKSGENTKSTQKTEEPAKFTDNDQDAIELLTSEHKEVKALFEEYQRSVDKESSSKELTALAQKICSLLTVHAKVEEEFLYPALRKSFDTSELIDEAAIEHATIKSLIEQIVNGNRRDSLYDAKVKVLGEYVDHHVKEEEGQIFPKAKILKLDMEEIGKAIVLRKAELLLEIPITPDTKSTSTTDSPEEIKTTNSSSQKTDASKVNPKDQSSERKPVKS